MENLMSPEIKDLMAALSKAQASLEGASKDSINPYFKSKYADLASVWNACRKPLTDNGLSISQITQVIEGKTHLITLLCHTSGQWMKSILPLPLDKERDPQALGKCITYCRRYALAAIVGIYQEDDDAEGLMERDKKKSGSDLTEEINYLNSDIENFSENNNPETENQELYAKNFQRKPGKKISPSQLKWLMSDLNKLKDSEFINRILKTYNVSRLDDLTMSEFDIVIANVKEKLSEKNKVA